MVARQRPARVATFDITCAEEQAAREQVRLNDQIYCRFIVIHTFDSGVFRAFGTDKPAVHRCNFHIHKESVLPACLSRVGAVRSGGCENGIEIHFLLSASESVFTGLGLASG